MSNYEALKGQSFMSNYETLKGRSFIMTEFTVTHILAQS